MHKTAAFMFGKRDGLGPRNSDLPLSVNLLRTRNSRQAAAVGIGGNDDGSTIKPAGVGGHTFRRDINELTHLDSNWLDAGQDANTFRE